MRRYSRKFGIEFEFECSWETLSWYATRAINKIYGKKNYYSKNERFTSDFKLNQWHIKQENTSVAELTTPISSLRDIPKICSVIKLLDNGKIRPQDDCGMHVHIDVHDIDQYHIMSAWLLCERAIISCFPPSRRINGFCDKILDSPMSSRSLVAKLLEDRTESSAHADAISLSEYEDRRTVEIRLAEGTLDAEWVRSWITFLMYWFDYFKKRNPSRLACEKCNSISFEELMDGVSPDRKTLDSMNARYKKHHNNPYWT